MTAHARQLLAPLLILAAAAVAVSAQNTLAPTPPPVVTADNEPWFLSGRPITWSGNVYYPAGAQVHFNQDEMIRHGSFRGIPLYLKTTIEPGSIVFVPLEGGLMQPYERRRAGELAGTTGSTAPGFPVILPSDQRDLFERAGVAASQAPTPRPGMQTVGMVGWVAGEAAGPPDRPVPAPVDEFVSPAPARAVPGVFRSAAIPEGLNGAFVLYEGRRWFSDGPTVEYDPSRFVQASSYGTFPVYRERGRADVIYVQIVEGPPGLLSVYRVR
jgi:hypothetical protein